ncbi:MAG TPA: metal ABC transporter permease, partial [Ktedonobacterales bacterium]
GNILGVSAAQTLGIGIVSGATIVVLLVIGRPLLFASLDANVAAAKGVPVRALGLGFMVLLAVTVGVATIAVGALLVFALLLLPAAIAYQVTTRPYAGMGLAALLAVAFTWLGITIGFYTGVPSSVCISLLAFVGYVASVGVGALAPRMAARG